MAESNGYRIKTGTGGQEKIIPNHSVLQLVSEIIVLEIKV